MGDSGAGAPAAAADVVAAADRLWLHAVGEQRYAWRSSCAAHPEVAELAVAEVEVGVELRAESASSRRSLVSSTWLSTSSSVRDQIASRSSSISVCTQRECVLPAAACTRTLRRTRTWDCVGNGQTHPFHVTRVLTCLRCPVRFRTEYSFVRVHIHISPYTNTYVTSHIVSS